MKHFCVWILALCLVGSVSAAELAGRYHKVDQAQVMRMAEAAENSAEESNDETFVKTFFKMELLTTSATPDTNDLESFSEKFKMAYESLIAEYENPFGKTMDMVNVVSISNTRRLSAGRQLQNLDILVFLRASGFCYGCGTAPFFTNQLVRRNLNSAVSAVSAVSEDLKSGSPTEAELLGRISSMIASEDLGSIVDVISLDESLTMPTGKGKGKGKGKGGSKSSKKTSTSGKSGNGKGGSRSNKGSGKGKAGSSSNDKKSTTSSAKGMGSSSTATSVSAGSSSTANSVYAGSLSSSTLSSSKGKGKGGKAGSASTKPGKAVSSSSTKSGKSRSTKDSFSSASAKGGKGSSLRQKKSISSSKTSAKSR